jgi:hypothetical protein
VAARTLICRGHEAERGDQSCGSFLQFRLEGFRFLSWFALGWLFSLDALVRLSWGRALLFQAAVVVGRPASGEHRLMAF